MPRHRTGRRRALVAVATVLSAWRPQRSTAQSVDAAPAARSSAEWRRLLGAPQPAGDSAERAEWLARGEAALELGDAAAAQESFQRAALMAHAADTECSIVRAHMQAGEYRRALAFGAHAAYAHRDFPAGAALYAWLLHAGGQGAYALRKLDEAFAFSPDDATLRAARDALAQPWPQARGELLALPLRMAPYAHGTQPPPRARCIGSALLIDRGQIALAPLDGLQGTGEAAALWLRNGLGATVPARVQQRHDDLGIARLQLVRALPTVPLAVAAREPFAGSPGSMVEFAASSDGAPAWPLLRHGFFGRRSAGGERGLGLDAPPGPRGGPVFDGSGRLAGIALAGHSRADRWIPVQALMPRAMPTDSDAAPAALDAVFEVGLRHALQVLVPA
jgi:tetratricopeptide (TPR) repeat protein